MPGWWMRVWKKIYHLSYCKHLDKNHCPLYFAALLCNEDSEVQKYKTKPKNIHTTAYVTSPCLLAGELDIWSLYKRSAFTSSIIHILWCKTTFSVTQYMQRQATRHKYSWIIYKVWKPTNSQTCKKKQKNKWTCRIIT